jgi:hypothetical protein
VEEQKKSSSRGWARLQVGGELTVEHAHELRAQKAELQAQMAQAEKARVARQAANKDRKQLRRAGPEAGAPPEEEGRSSSASWQPSSSGGPGPNSRPRS